MFFAKLVQPFIGVGGPDACPATDQCLMFFVVVSNAFSRSESAPSGMGRRQARSKPRLRIAAAMQSAEHNHAPRPGAVRLTTTAPSDERVHRVSRSIDKVVRQPMHVRIGCRLG
jgi:hypothetical protein